MSRSTWACELKSLYHHLTSSSIAVTLHVSVWVEIPLGYTPMLSHRVTLHVSVWVEITGTNSSNSSKTSRSTWACELKWSILLAILLAISSRSTWACELKSEMPSKSPVKPCHAPRERVSWNDWSWYVYLVWKRHAPRERVSWNASY